MKMPSRFSTILVVLILAFASTNHVLADEKSYIVYLGEHSHGPEITAEEIERITDSHHEFLASFIGSKEKAKDAIFYSYTKQINGFAAVLKEEDAARIADHSDVLAVTLNQKRKLHTSHTWEFLSLEHQGVLNSDSLWRKGKYGEDIIIATLDTGVWPESESFKDEGYGPIPTKWKGSCTDKESYGVLNCNNKLIGAKKYNKGMISMGVTIPKELDNTRDYVGHGSHTLSTAAGNFVPDANLFGAANGTTKGGSPRARVAAYKVCWGDDCSDADILRGFEEAIHDGVDVLSVSLGGPAVDYSADNTAIGAFHAVKRGIVVICSASNDGPTPGTVTNVAPWIITVAASTFDREYKGGIKLQNGVNLKGGSLARGLPKKKMYPLILGQDAAAVNATFGNATLCLEGTINPKKVKGKILVCQRGDSDRLEKSKVALKAGAAGLVLANDESYGEEVFSEAHFLPAVHLAYSDALRLYKYINATKKPLGYVLPSQQVLGVKPSPVIASFSSRGPNPVTPEILKPDITAPGVKVFASYSPDANPTDADVETRSSPFAFLSGTSMSCPHVSGVVGLLKKLHPHWSPAAVKSAIITTARSKDNTDKPILDFDLSKKATPYAYGAGHIRPNAAADPGLVYDLTVDDHLNFLCSLGYNHTQIRIFKSYDCPKDLSITNFNYPSIVVPNRYGTTTITRRLKNVGTPATYVPRLPSFSNVKLSVEPESLAFKRIGEEKSFKLKFEVTGNDLNAAQFGELLWTDGRHYVRSPVVVGKDLSTPSEDNLF